MNRPLLFAALAVSLAGNAWYLIAAAPRPATATSAEAPAALSATKSVPGAPAARSASPSTAGVPDDKTATEAAGPRGLTWRTPTTDDEFRALADDLRAAGFPSHVINRVVSDLYEQRRRAESPTAKVPFWQRRALQKEVQEYERATAKNLEAILGPDARRSARLDALTRARQYGSLSDAKIDAIAGIERDYREMQNDVFRPEVGGVIDDWAAIQKQRNLLKSEQRADLEKILTPAELAEYEMRNSDAARSVAWGLRELNVTPAEFASLYEIQRDFDAGNTPLSGRVTAEQMTARENAEQARLERVRGVLNDERFYAYLSATNPGYRALVGLAKDYPSVTPAGAYQVMQLVSSIQRERNTLFAAGGARTPEAVQAAYAAWNARLEALIGPAAAAAYRKTMYGRAMVAPTMGRPGTPRG